MHKIFMALLGIAVACTANAQHSFRVVVKDAASQTPLIAVTIRVNNTTMLTDNSGYAVLQNLAAGRQTITFSHTGYQPVTETLLFPLADTAMVTILMETENEELAEVIVQSTRTSRSIKNTPTRVETIDGEELDEKNNMRPANVSMLLHESTGLQVQQTSATSGNAGIRVQGLDGRYTQLLKDGYPNFGNFASGLSVLEIPPLDLKQVEIIKGPASTLYGGGAIAGVINFISKLPQDDFQGDFILNQSNVGQTNLGGFIAQKKGKFGYSLLGLINLQRPYDVDRDDFSELPQNNNFTIHPRLFWYATPSITISLGNSFTRGANTGGDMQVIDGKGNADHSYFEKNNTVRNTTTLEVTKKFPDKSTLLLKQALAIFDRQISIPGYVFAGISSNSFSDVSYTFFRGRHTMIGGLNIVADRFVHKDTGRYNAASFTAGMYFQDTWDIANHIKVESGLRVDNVHYKSTRFSNNQVFALPRVSVLFNITDKISSRIGAGLGYKTPAIFTEQTESIQYRGVLPLNNVTAERSAGGTADINFSTAISEELTFSINQLFFYTRINKPLVLQPDLSGNYFFYNAAKPVVSNGFETNIKFIFKEDLKLFAGYTFTNTKATYLPGNPSLLLLPKNKLNLTLMYEKEDNFKLGLEGYFTDRQYLSNGSRTARYWEFGFMAQKTFKKVSFFLNFENFTDQRQSNYKAVVNPPHNNPTFDDIWNHTEGFVFNGGIKLKL